MSSDKKTVNKHFEDRFIQHLARNKNHPVMVAMRNAINRFSDRPIRLTKDLKYYFSKIPHRTRGFTIKEECLSLFPIDAQQMLQKGLSLGCVIVGINGYIFTLTPDRFEYIDDPKQETFV